MHARKHARMRARRHAGTQARRHACRQARAQSRMQARTHARMQARMHARTHAGRHAGTQARGLMWKTAQGCTRGAIRPSFARGAVQWSQCPGFSCMLSPGVGLLAALAFSGGAGLPPPRTLPMAFHPCPCRQFPRVRNRTIHSLSDLAKRIVERTWTDCKTFDTCQENYTWGPRGMFSSSCMMSALLVLSRAATIIGFDQALLSKATVAEDILEHASRCMAEYAQKVLRMDTEGNSQIYEKMQMYANPEEVFGSSDTLSNHFASIRTLKECGGS
eukprot:15434125-Alexandrium_andersonii.AAC.1